MLTPTAPAEFDIYVGTDTDNQNTDQKARSVWRYGEERLDHTHSSRVTGARRIISR